MLKKGVMMNYKPMNDYVLVLVNKHDEKTKGGLYKPETAKETMNGKVVAVGDGLYTQQGVKIPMRLRVEDEVLLDGTGIQLKIDGVKYNLYRESEILMVKND